MSQKSLSSFLRWILLAAALVGIDQLTKACVVSSLSLYDGVRITSFFNISLQHNAGAAFSFLADQNGWQKWFFTGLAVVVSLVILWILKFSRGNALINSGLVLVMAGALGNLIDRLHHGYVIDFLDFHWGRWHYPAFNGADSFITMGVICLVVEEFIVNKAKRCVK